jgi:glycosyltransferase involved in cell wall biosynthesis
LPVDDRSMDATYLDCLKTDLVCLSHLRWDFVYQRPQHLMARFAKHRRVFYVEEPLYETIDTPRMHVSGAAANVIVVVPCLPWGTSPEEAIPIQQKMLARLFADYAIQDPTFWYYTAMAMVFTRDFEPTRVIYDCMDELSAFRGAPPELLAYERELLERADHVFTGGYSLYEAKKGLHASVHAFPSSIDVEHFSAARHPLPEPADERGIPSPRLGFYGVIDERADLELIAQSARLRRTWQFIMVGPVAKVDPDLLPRADNIHYLGMKSYAELPAHLAHWDVAMMPFAINESTRFISPTKTPEYLAAGKPVVSTPIRDVVRPYGEEGLVHIARNADEFVSAVEEAMHEQENDPQWLQRVDRFLAHSSWDRTWAGMAEVERTTQPVATQSATAQNAKHSPESVTA